MPIEVKELVVKAIVSNTKAPKSRAQNETSALSTKRVIAACVEQVLRILEKEKER